MQQGPWIQTLALMACMHEMIWAVFSKNERGKERTKRRLQGKLLKCPSIAYTRRCAQESLPRGDAAIRSRAVADLERVEEAAGERRASGGEERTRRSTVPRLSD